MDRKKVYITREGLEELKREHVDLVKVKRPEVVDRVAKAREMGDLSENSEYHAAKENLALIDGRTEELAEIIKMAEIIADPGKGGKTVKIGSQVTVKINGKKEVFTLVGEWEADPHQKKISHESPLGKALMGKVLNEKIEVEAPAGKIIYHVVEIK